MAPRRRIRAREAELTFETISIEGGLLAPEWLARVAQLAAGQQTDAEYRIPKGCNVRDETGRYWRIAQAHWAEFQSGRKAGAEPRALAARFVVPLLSEAFGFGTLAEIAPVALEGRTYPIGHAALGGRVPVVVAPAGAGLDDLDETFGDENRRRSAFGVGQEYLNASAEALWGIASDGLVLRILRDNASLTRPTWIETDLERIFTEERYADFTALWLLAHESRFGREGAPTSECPLESWRSAGREEGTRAREHLRNGVEEAIAALGTGFLNHPGNGALREALHGGELTIHAYFQELLRLVYRIIFLLTAEERDVLHPPESADAARKLYAEGYSIRRLRDRAVKRSAHDRFVDLWEGAKILLRGLAAGEPRLAIPALGGIFAAGQCPHLDAAKLENRFLLQAIFKLSWLREESGLSRVNWRDMGPEELGSVYESLLELVPRIVGGRRFEFVTGDEAKGNARKTTGSYYTPDSLVQVLLDSALDPVVNATVAAHPGHEVEALLRLSIVDPACGSGHFLLAAGRRLADVIAKLRANGTPSMAQYRAALRDVVGHCLFGVDLNPMAVELCRVSLWMEAVEPGRPLSFLDSHVQLGNALLGTTPELIAKGIPDAAFDPIEGDDRKTASALKKKNKAAAEGQRGFDTLWAKASDGEAGAVVQAVKALEAAPDTDLAAVKAKDAQWSSLRGSYAFRHQKFVADAWCAAFVWPKPMTEPKKVDPLITAAPTNDLWRPIRDGKGDVPELTRKTVQEIADQYHFFHWHLAFPQVFERGGFDVVLGNPPWERVTLKEKEWFATRDPHVASARTGAERLRRIAELEGSHPELLKEFQAAKRTAAGEKAILRRSGGYPLCGRGDVNTFAVFAELGRRLSRARAGMVLETGIVTTDTTQEFVADLIRASALVEILDFDNRSGIFPAVQGNVRFCLLTTAKQRQDTIRAAAQLRSVMDLQDPQRTWALSREDVFRMNPNTLTIPLFRTQRDADIVRGIYARLECLDVEGEHRSELAWEVPMQRMLHMGDDSHLFRTPDQLQDSGFVRTAQRWAGDKGDYIPLFEAKLCHQFDHRAGTFDGIPVEDRFGTHPATREMTVEEHEDPLSAAEPRYWVHESEIRARLEDTRYLLGFRDAVSAVADSRSLVAAFMPAVGAGHTLQFLFPKSAAEATFLCAWFNSIATDYVFRVKAAGAHASFFLLKQLPIPAKTTIAAEIPWCDDRSISAWVTRRVLELSFTAWDLQPLAKDLGYDGPPFRWDEGRRVVLRAELDAAFFHLYGIARGDVEYVLETFPIVRKNDEKAHGEYRTKRLILEIYDAIAEAIMNGRPYRSRLDPPPADTRVAHPPRRVGESRATARSR